MLLVALSIAHAATFAELPDLADLARSSEAVVQGVVTEAETVSTAAGLQTRYDIAVGRTLAGEARERVEVLLPGGHLGALTQRAAGIPLWRPGDEVVVFVPQRGLPPLSGVLTVEAGRPVDLLARPVPASVDEIEALVLGARQFPLR